MLILVRLIGKQKYFAANPMLWKVIAVAVLPPAPGAVLQLLTWEHNIYKWICCQSIFCQGFLPKAPSQKIFGLADIMLVTAWMVLIGY